MKRLYLLNPLITAIIIGIAILYLTLPPAKANTTSALLYGNCAQTPLQGDYEFLAPATVIVSPGTVIAVPEAFLSVSPAPYASEGQVNFAADGTVLLTTTGNFHGNLAEPISYGGNYVVNDDCTAVVQFEQGSMFSIRIMQTETFQRLVSTTPGFVLIPDESASFAPASFILY